MNMTWHGRAQSVAPRYDSEHEPWHDGVYPDTCSYASQLPPPDYDRVNAKAFKAHFFILATDWKVPLNNGF